MGSNISIAHRLLGLGALCALLVCGCAPAQEPIANPSFESWDGGAKGWNFDNKVRSKGKLSQETAHVREGKFALELAPNSANASSDNPFGIGQLVSLAPYGGRDISVSAWLGATGSANAVVGVYMLDARGQNVGGQQLRQAAATESMTRQETHLSVPAAASGVKMILFCVVEGTSGRAYFDDIRLAASTSASSAAAPAKNVALSANIRVDVSKKTHMIPAALFGANLEWAFNANDLWDESSKRPREQVVELTRNSGVSLIRFPGGVFSDYYHWRDGIGNPSARPTTLHYPKGPKSRHVFGSDELTQFAKSVNARLLLTVNAGTGTAQEAADWVRYMNKAAPNAVAYWEIGNELYMKDDLSGASMPPKDYARKVRDFAKQMRAANPSIKLGAIGGINQGRYSFISYPEWTRTVLQEASGDIDFLAVHNAYAPVLINADKVSPKDAYAAMLAAPVLIGKNLDALSKLIDDVAGDRADHIHIAVTEWGPFFHVLPSSPWVDHVKTLGSALFVADTLRVFAEHPKVEIATFFKLVEPTFMGWMGQKDGGYAAKPALLAFNLYTKHFFPQLVAISTDSPGYDSPEIGVVSAVKGVPYLTAIASVDPTAKRLSLIAINKNPDNSIETEVSLAGIGRMTGGTSWTLTGSSLDSHTGTTLLKVPGLTWATQRTMTPTVAFDAPEKANVKLVQSPLTVSGAAIHYTFPAHSVTCLELTYE